MICIVAASLIRCCRSLPVLANRPAARNFSLYSASKTAFIFCQKPSCHLKTVFFVTTYGTMPASKHRVKKMCAKSPTLSSGLS